MDRFRIPVLRILNQEHHQESDDGRAGIDDQLSRVGKMKGRTEQRPDCDDENRDAKRPGAAEDGRCSPGEGAEGVLGATEEVALVFLSLTLFGLLGDITLPSRFD
jgi:hypothetical protein